MTNCKKCGAELTTDNIVKGKSKNGIFFYKTCKKCISNNMSKAQTGKKISIETRQKISKSLTGIKHTEEARKNMSKAHTGLKRTPEQRARMSNVRKGIVFTEEHKLNIKKAIVKRHSNTAYRKKLSDAHRGVPLSKSHIRALAESHTGLKRTPEQRARMSKAQAERTRLKKSFTEPFIEYKNTMFRSSWEVKVAKWLDKNRIKWEFESHTCVHKLANNHHYLIDFYLPDLDKYIEVKGWWDINSKQKYDDASKSKDICIIDRRNIDNINLNLFNY